MPRKKRDIKILTLDTETIGLDGDLKRIAVYDGVEVVYGYTFADVEPHIIGWWEKGFSLHIYIHNMEFDLRRLAGIFSLGNVAWGQSRIINNRYVKLACKYYSLHDSFSLLPMSLASLSKSFDLEHGKLDLWEAVQKAYPDQYTDHVDFLSRCDKDDPLYLEYLGYDVISLYELIYKLADVSGLGLEIVKCLTTASMSKRIFRTGYKGTEFITAGQEKTDFEILTSCKAWDSPKEVNRNHSKEFVSYAEIESKIRQAYYGGRTEVFKPHLLSGGGIMGYHFDVNSLYPSVMIDNDFPIGFPEYFDRSNQIEWQFQKYREYHSTLGFIKAHVYVPETHIPPLPSKIGKLVFVTGHIEGWWTYPELEYAINEYGVEVIQYQECIHFEQTFKVFHNFVAFFSKMKEDAKKAGNAALVQFAKLILNTAYGWTALVRDKPALDGIDKLEKRSESLLFVDDEMGCLQYLSHIKSDTIQVQVASYVTSYARITLLKALKHMDQISEVYYCDTDSIVCRDPLPMELVDPYRLGYWDLEGELLEGYFLQPKVYSERKTNNKETIKFKGVSKNTQNNFDFEFYENMYQIMCDYEDQSIRLDQDGMYRGMMFEQEKGSTRIRVEENKQMLRGILYLQKNKKDLLTMEIRDKYLNLGNKQKRMVSYKENTTRPWHMETLEDFHSFTFKQDYSDIKQSNGTLMNMCI